MDKPRSGFTTGSCAAAASKAAAYMLFSGKRKEEIEIVTPKGITYQAELLDIDMHDDRVSCAIKKDSGDDPDITNGAHIYSTVKITEGTEGEITISAGEGVGIVTRPGLDQPVGNAAINSVPRKMIEKEVREILDIFDYRGALEIIISVPEGAKLAAKTFNPRLGIEGGISILGTSGIVEPMSMKAILDTIHVELSQNRALGREYICISPGNYGLDFMKSAYDFDLDKSVKCSNFIGETLDMTLELGFKGVLLVGHIGKLVKLAAGIMNTHSREADGRMEVLTVAALKANASNGTLLKITDCLTTTEAFEIIDEEGITKKVMEYIIERIEYYLNKRCNGGIQVECIVFSNESGQLGCTKGAAELIKRIKENA